LSSAGDPFGHSRAFELLPWLVNDSLATPERDAVELHVRTCIVCRREIKEQQRLLAALQAQPIVHLSAQNAFDRLSNELDDGRHARHAPRDPAYLPFLRFGVVAAMGVALVSFLFWLAPDAPQQSADYATLATEPSGRGPHFDVIFSRDTTAAEIQTLLDSVGGEIVAGPSEVGRYGIRVTSGPAGATDLAKALAQLAGDPHVRLAARAYTESGK
jgi:hypothetical protein